MNRYNYRVLPFFRINAMRNVFHLHYILESILVKFKSDGILLLDSEGMDG